jgi:hypothetical protein
LGDDEKITDLKQIENHLRWFYVSIKIWVSTTGRPA